MSLIDDRFARAHLESEIDERVLLALLIEPDHAAPAAAIALDVRADEYEVDVALRRFAAAGIATVEENPPRYRIARSLVAGGDDVSRERDPICGMWVDPALAHRADEHAFCSVRCLAWYERDSRGRERGTRTHSPG